MTASTESHVRFDPYDVELIADPYPMFARLREEAPLYYNAQYDFYAVSRFADVNKGAGRPRHVQFRAGRDPGVDQGQPRDPAGHAHLRRPADPRRAPQAAVAHVHPTQDRALEPKIREFCAQALDPLVGSGRFDFVTDLGAQMPMKVISMLLGIPEDDQEYIRDADNAQTAHRSRQADESRRTRPVRRRDVRGLHRLARQPSVRRHHDRAAQRRIRRRDRHDPAADPRRDPHLPQRRRRRRQRDHHPADRLGGKGSRRAPRPAPRARREPR